MDDKRYDVIVVGARCAGSPTAMLLARKGYKVLLVDRAIFPSDTISSHLIHPPGVAALRRWGLLDQLVASGCPPIHTYALDFGTVAITGHPGTPEEPVAYSPRRTVLDTILVDAAAAAGAEVREGFSVEELVVSPRGVVGIRGHGKGGATVTDHARVVVGADGRYSLVARGVRAESYHDRPQLAAGYYAYWSGLPMNGRFETYMRGDRGFAAMPTHDGLTLTIGGWPYAQMAANKKDLDGNFLQIFDRVPAFAARIRDATRVSRIVGAAVANYFRKPYGPGWALVGDAGYNKDPITAQGITDAFRDAELLADALDASFTGRRTYDAAMEDYRTERDHHVLSMYELTCQLASFEPPRPEMLELMGAIQGNPGAMDEFMQVNAGVMPPETFFAPEHVGQLFASAAAHA